MKRTCLRWLVASSLLLAAIHANAATRPRYGGTLRISTSAQFTSLDPAEPGQPDSMARRNIAKLLFETLVVLDEHGVPQPALADSWTSSAGGQRWEFNLRRGVTFSDGSPLTAETAAAGLRKANPAWKVTAQSDGVSIELEAPTADLLNELALPRNAMIRRGEQLVGTGPFVTSQWDPGHRLVLVARDDYRDGRAFLDSIDLEMGKSMREQNISFDLGRTDVIDIAPEQSRHAATEGRRLTSSSPTELMALYFARDAESATEQKLREALSLSIDRPLMNRALLQNDGEPAGGLLPAWMTGYGLVFSTEANPTRAKQLRADTVQPRGWTLGYDNEDALARVMAERVSLNARDAGLSIQTTTATATDIRLIRVPLTLSNGRIELTELCASLGLPAVKLADSSAESVYGGENLLRQSRRVVPLLHLRYVWGISPSVQGWSVGRDGSVNLPEVWLSGRQ